MYLKAETQYRREQLNIAPPGGRAPFSGRLLFLQAAAEEEDRVINMDDNVETGEFRRVVKLEFGAFPRYFSTFSRGRLRLILLLYFRLSVFWLICVSAKFIWKNGAAANVSIARNATGTLRLSTF